MRIENEFTVAAPIEQAWTLLTDIPAIAPCLPGASLTSSEDGVHRGRVKVRVGPITSQYEGTARFEEQDDATHRARITAKGRESRGAGNAHALIAAQLTDEGGRTRVSLATDLTISGKAAQFGRGVMVEVSEKLLGQFATCLEAKLSGEAEPRVPASATASEPAARPGPSDTDTAGTAAAAHGRPDATDDVEALDLMGVAGGAIAKRVLPVAVVIVVAVVLYLLLR